MKAQHIQFYNCNIHITTVRLAWLDVYCVPGEEEQWRRTQVRRAYVYWGHTGEKKHWSHRNEGHSTWKGDWSWREGGMEDELRRDPWGKGEDKRQMGIWETEATEAQQAAEKGARMWGSTSKWLIIFIISGNLSFYWGSESPSLRSVDLPV